MPAYPIAPAETVDVSAGFTQLPAVHEYHQMRVVNLLIRREGAGYSLIVTNAGALFDPHDVWVVDLPITEARLHGAVQACRQAWRAAVDRVVGGQLVLHDAWDQRPADTARAVLPALALAGATLFEELFFPDGSLGDPTPRDRLQELGTFLQTELHRGTHWLQVTSDDFHAPWNLLYSAPLLDRVHGSDAEWSGFWGYQHVVEHAPYRTGGTRTDAPPLDDPLQVGIFRDPRIDAALGVRCNAAVDDALAGYDPAHLAVTVGTRSSDLSAALAPSPRPDQLLYFCGHGVGDGDATLVVTDEPRIALGDGISVTPRHINQWLGRSRLDRRPIVFLNACQSAHATSPFYRGFAPVFLARGASAVLGTQTEVPAVFAGEFARRFLDRFLAGGTSVGELLLALRREFVDTYANPLGLLYTLYRGGDVRLLQPVPRRP